MFGQSSGCKQAMLILIKIHICSRMGRKRWGCEGADAYNRCYCTQDASLLGIKVAEENATGITEEKSKVYAKKLL